MNWRIWILQIVLLSCYKQAPDITSMPTPLKPIHHGQRLIMYYGVRELVNTLPIMLTEDIAGHAQ
jgi:hypothetical protein